MSLNLLMEEQKVEFEKNLDYDLMPVVTNTAKNNIRRKDGFFLRSVVETGKKHDMVMFAESIHTLLLAGTFSEGDVKAFQAN